jgi:hypothetical protein
MKILRDKSSKLPNTPFKALLQKCVYNEHYGTPELLKRTHGKILNVADALQSLLRYIKYDASVPFQQQNESQFQGKTNIGTLNIYMDREKSMEFV